ncbi:MAG: NUDIX domain-containing protein, partial [Candidatus Woesearchaeota archaeon]|nr:NUDIX domain-containing protein [Candidatus Woesearchaeota archaeon]
VILKDNKILLLNKKESQIWELPGGKIENGESPEQTAVREAKEELGVDVKPIHYLGYTDLVHKEKELRSHKVLCKIIAGIPKIMEPEVFESFDWLPFSQNNIQKYSSFNLAPNVLQLFAQFEHGEFTALFGVSEGITTLIEKRPWGMFEQFMPGPAGIPCAVKILTVQPNNMLSLQYHHNRDEFWRVLSGTGTAEVGTEKFELKIGNEVFIKRGISHRLSSKSSGLEILELAFGRFDESDIVRLEDKYGRK